MRNLQGTCTGRVEETESWVRGEGREGTDLDRVIREGLLEVVTSEPRLE